MFVLRTPLKREDRPHAVGQADFRPVGTVFLTSPPPLFPKRLPVSHFPTKSIKGCRINRWPLMDEHWMLERKVGDHRNIVDDVFYGLVQLCFEQLGGFIQFINPRCFIEFIIIRKEIPQTAF